MERRTVPRSHEGRPRARQIRAGRDRLAGKLTAVPPVAANRAGALAAIPVKAGMDATTIRAVAGLARKRAERGSSAVYQDGMARLGARRALEQLATDLEISADELDRTAKKPRRPA